MPLSMDRWRGKVAIVTGASGGIGASIARHLVGEGLQVVGLARRSERVEELAQKLQDKKGKLHAIKADINKEEDILRAFKWTSDNLGPVHILVNNAGSLFATRLIDGDTDLWRTTFDTNVLGLCIATREAVKIMKDNKIDGHIVHINSIKLASSPAPVWNVYPATKHAVTALTETLRQEFNREGLKIKVTSISPGIVEAEATFSEYLDLDSKDEEFLLGCPQLKQEDIADAVVYVLSTPPHVQVHQLTVKPLGEPFVNS